MPVPILLITGFLGAGKTTLINRLLQEPDGRRLAAVVNDFGAVNIDAALLAGASDDVISLKNGCICCSLLGDLLQTLTTILRRDPVPDGIVIETSGVSTPGEIVRTLLDPVIWSAASLETVVCVTDARTLADQPGLFDDGLWQAQLAAADFVALSKTDLVGETERDVVRARLRQLKPGPSIYDMIDGRLPSELLFAGGLSGCAAPPIATARRREPSFQTMTWTSSAPVVMARFQEMIGRYGGVLVRAKGFVTFAERPDDRMLFQLVGTRATIGRAPAGIPDGPAVQLVFIAKAGMLDERDLAARLDKCRADCP